MSNVNFFLLSEVNWFEIDIFLKQDNRTMIYYSKKYLEFIEAITDSICTILISKDGKEVTGVFPFYKKDTKIGAVINSSPFYGSHGGCIAFDRATEELLINSFLNYCSAQSVLSATVIPASYTENMDLYEQIFQADYVSPRYAQVKALPFTNSAENTSSDIADLLMQSIPSKTRNMIRKPFKNGVKAVVDNSTSALQFLKKTHEDNCKAIGIVAKQPDFFNALNSFFVEDEDYKIYVAYHEDQPISAMLCLYYHKTVEYFVPAIVETYRHEQPLSMLIFEAMKDAINTGFLYWNWGGTTISSENVFRFKESWGTNKGDYKYYTKVFDKSIYELSKADIEQHMSYFFVIGYDKLLN